jgi:hypothetical protein
VSKICFLAVSDCQTVAGACRSRTSIRPPKAVAQPALVHCAIHSPWATAPSSDAWRSHLQLLLFMIGAGDYFSFQRSTNCAIWFAEPLRPQG